MTKLWYLLKSFGTKDEEFDFLRNRPLYCKRATNYNRNNEISEILYSCESKCRCLRQYKIVYPKNGGRTYFASTEDAQDCSFNNYEVHKSYQSTYIQNYNEKVSKKIDIASPKEENVTKDLYEKYMLPEQKQLLDHCYDLQKRKNDVMERSCAITAKEVLANYVVHEYKDNETKLLPVSIAQRSV